MRMKQSIIQLETRCYVRGHSSLLEVFTENTLNCCIHNIVPLFLISNKNSNAFKNHQGPGAHGIRQC